MYTRTEDFSKATNLKVKHIESKIMSLKGGPGERIKGLFLRYPRLQFVSEIGKAAPGK